LYLLHRKFDEKRIKLWRVYQMITSDALGCMYLVDFLIETGVLIILLL